MSTDPNVPHPKPKPSQQIGRILWVSVIVSTFALAFSLATLGFFSLWVLPGAYGFSIAHNITLLVLSAKERKKLPETLNGTLTATSKKASIICTWILVLLWMAAAGMVAASSILISQDEYDLPYFYIIPWFEFSFAVIEVGVTGFLGVQCIRERRRIIGLTNATKWYHLHQENYTFT